MKADIRLNKLHKVITLSLYDIDQYKYIFNDTPRRMDLLRNTANSFFYFYKVYFWRRMYTDIARFSENAGKGRTKKLTITLYEELAKKLDLDKYDIIVSNNIEIRKLAEPFIFVRNKITVHNDTKYAKEELKIDSDQDALLKIEKIFDILKENAGYFRETYKDMLPIGYVIGPTGDAQNLMRYLWKGYNAEKQ